MAFRCLELLANFAKGNLIIFISAVSSKYMAIALLPFSAPAAKSSMNVILSLSGAIVGNVTLYLSACSLSVAESKNGLQVRPNGSLVKH